MTVPVLRFRRDESITPVPGDGVFITSERGASKRLHGTAVSLRFPSWMARSAAPKSWIGSAQCWASVRRTTPWKHC